MGRTVAHRARRVLPVVLPSIDDGCVVESHGRIVAVGRWADLAGQCPLADTEVHDHGDVCLAPGLVNAHAHLELTGHGTVPYNGSFWGWLEAVAAKSRAAAAEGTEPLAEAATRGAAILAETGTAAIADTTLWGVRADFDGVLVSLHEFIAFREDASDRPSWPAALERLSSDAAAGRPCGLEPHSPYTVHPRLVAEAYRRATERRCLFAMHFAETEMELDLLEHGAGPMAAAIASEGAPVSEYVSGARAPVARLAELGALEGALLFHGNYVPDEEFGALARAGASVVYCPRSHMHFGHDAHPAPRMLAAGVNVCLGTDGLVSNYGLDMRAEMLCALERCPALSPYDVLTMATLCGARALRLDGQLGALAPGLRASLCALPLDPWG